MNAIIIQCENLNATNNQCIISFEQSKYDLKFKKCFPWSIIIKQNNNVYSYIVMNIEDVDSTNNILKIILHDNNDDNKESCSFIIKLNDRTINSKNLNSALKLNKLRH